MKYLLIFHSFQSWEESLVKTTIETLPIRDPTLPKVMIEQKSQLKSLYECLKLLLTFDLTTVSISGLDPDSPQSQPWQSKIVAGNKGDELYSQ